MNAAIQLRHLLTRANKTLVDSEIAETSDLLLTIPGLAESPALRHLATIRISNHPELQKLMQRSALETNSPRTTARRQLIERLRQTNLADDVARAEMATADLKLLLESSQPKSLPLLTVHYTFNHVSIDGVEVADSHQLVQRLQRRSGELQLQALRSAAAAETEFLCMRQSRLGKIPEDAQMPFELSMLAIQRQANAEQLDFVDTQLQHLAFVAISHGTTWQKTSLTPINDASGLAGLLVRRLHAAKFDLEQRQRRLHAIHDRTERVMRLATADAFFDSEAMRLSLERNLLRAQVRVAEECVELCQHENRLAETLMSDDTNAHEPAAQLFEHLSHVEHKLAVAKTRVELTAWKVGAIQQLFDDGHATWMEWTSARVRHEEAVAEVVSVLQQQTDYRTIADALSNLTNIDVVDRD